MEDLSFTTRSAWLSTAASQIFLMELGFLCLEGGYVQSEYIQSLIIKNIEDIFCGFTTYAVFGYAIVTYNYEYIALYNLPYSEWDTIFVNATFAATTATIMSGAILERMSSLAYSSWVFVIILINYSFMSRWVWESDGWLYKLGFIDCAGCSAVHMVGGIGGLVLVTFLGPRYSSLQNVNEPLNLDTNAKLKEKHAPRNLLFVIIGTMILWYGWIAFNSVSPIIGNVGIGGDVGLPALLTIILPSCSSFSVYICTYIEWPKWEFLFKIGIVPGTQIIERSAENLSNAILTGLVVVTASCYTINLISAIFIGFIVPFPVFIISHYLRNKFSIDDPLDVISIHLFGGILGLLAEGLCNHEHGLLITFKYRHFLVQCLGIIVTLGFNIVLDIIWWVLLKYVIFRNCDIKQTPLSVSLSASRQNVYKMDFGLAFRELLFGDTHFSKFVMIKFHKYIKGIYCSEQLDFIIAVYHFRKLFERKQVLTQRLQNTPTPTDTGIELPKLDFTDPSISMVKSVMSVVAHTTIADVNLVNKKIRYAFRNICNLYIANNSEKQINISSKIKKKIMNVCDLNNPKSIKISIHIDAESNHGFGYDKTVFNGAFMETLALTLTNLKVFLQDKYWNEKMTSEKVNDKVYAVVNDTYSVKWFHEPTNVSMEHNLKPYQSQRKHCSVASYIEARDGKIKSIEQEISDILR